MRKRVYLVLKELYNFELVSHEICKQDGISSRVRNEIFELRRTYGVEMVMVIGFAGQRLCYFLKDSEENYKRVKKLLKMHDKREKN